ncbi:collagen-like protein [Klebsiella oxytoca]|nr:collagen-like protein [Klebsiella oxytoca]ELT9977605.1 collagen-like protein [Klebsiella oxytoca]
MANEDGIKISELDSAKALTGAEKLPVVQGGETVAATIDQIKILIPAGADGKDGIDGKDGAPGKDGVDGKDGAPGKDGTEVIIGSESNNALVNNKDSTAGPLGLKVLVSKDIQNELFILEDETNPGLYARPISAMLFAENDSIKKTSAYEGNPKNAAISVRISAKAGNSIQLVTSATEGGLYVPEKTVSVDENSITGTGSLDNPLSVNVSKELGNALSVTEKGLWAKDTISSLTRNGTSFNFSVSHPDVKTAEYACGPLGKGVYFKTTLLIPSGADYNMINQIFLDKLPCMADGTLVPYNVWCAGVNGNNKVPTWMICQERPTHALTLSTGVIAPILRETGKDSGLPDYPETEALSVNYITFTGLQFYSKQS